MKKWSMIIDIEKCEDCNNCFLACKDEHVDNDWPGYSLSQPRHGQRWMNIFRKERGQYPLIDVAYRPTPCMHCDNAPCVKTAGDASVYTREDGIVMIDPDKARGRKDIMKACPYEVVWWNEEKNVPQKCTMCAHLLDEGWDKPRCVQACPTGALRMVHMSDREMASIKSTEGLECLYPEYGTSPRIFYKNLYRFEKCFVSGSVAFEKEGVIDCAEGASIVLIKDSRRIAETAADNFGDFKFDSLEENSGEYRVEIRFRDYAKKVLNVNLESSMNIGTITLSRSKNLPTMVETDFEYG
jgi:Fe-S-cluster-containing dehydrogenase component